MTIGTLDTKDRLRIPRALREALGLKPGDAVAYALVDDELRIRKVNDPYAAYGPVARQALRWAREHPAELRTLDQVMEEFGITEADVAAASDLDDE